MLCLPMLVMMLMYHQCQVVVTDRDLICNTHYYHPSVVTLHHFSWAFDVAFTVAMEVYKEALVASSPGERPNASQEQKSSVLLHSDENRVWRLVEAVRSRQTELCVSAANETTQAKAQTVGGVQGVSGNGGSGDYFNATDYGKWDCGKNGNNAEGSDVAMNGSDMYYAAIRHKYQHSSRYGGGLADGSGYGQWCGFLEVLTNINALDIKHNAVRATPYSWAAALTAAHFLQFYASHLASATLRCSHYDATGSGSSGSKGGGDVDGDMQVAECAAAAVEVAKLQLKSLPQQPLVAADTVTGIMDVLAAKHVSKFKPLLDKSTAAAATAVGPRASSGEAPAAGVEQTLSAQLQNVIILDEIAAEAWTSGGASSVNGNDSNSIPGISDHSNSSTGCSNNSNDTRIMDGGRARAIALNSAVVSDFVQALDDREGR